MLYHFSNLVKTKVNLIPNSLLCPPIKILERLILPSLQENLDIPNFQHGFRQKHSTVTALNDFNINVSDGFSKKVPPDRTVLLQLDLSKAFDMVNLDKLLKDLDHSTLPPALKRWFCAYLKGRQSKVHFRNSTSDYRNVRTGVPQGAVTSPVLFNFYPPNYLYPPKVSMLFSMQMTYQYTQQARTLAS